MNQRRCHHCGSDLHVETDGALVYCWNCAAPQLTLSEELREKAEALRRDEEHSSQNDTDHARKHTAKSINWRKALVLSMFVSGGLALIAVLLPPVALLIWLWAPLAPNIVLSLYIARNRETRLTRGIGMRVGLVCGVLIIASFAIVNAIELDTLRFGLHRMHDFDANVNNMLAQMKSQIVTQSGPQAAEMFRIFEIPEFRAGSFIAGLGMLSIIVLMLTTAGGALAGFLRSRNRPA